MSKDIFRLDDRVAVVTGAAGGIGTAVSHQLGEAGATIIATDVDQASLDRLVGELVAKKIKVHAIKSDASKESEVISLYEQARKLTGKTPQILVNNAFQGLHVAPHETSLTEWSRIMDTSLTGYFLNAREFGKHAIAEKVPGAVVNISSIAGSSAIGRGNFAYSVAKGGTNQMTRELAIEWATSKIRVNAIQPCSVNTPGWRKWVETEGEKAKVLMKRLLEG
ncbi:MAG: SDR family NAD(P)-dependent oxidoreductase, partial [Actinomycetota bacterium]